MRLIIDPRRSSISTFSLVFHIVMIDIILTHMRYIVVVLSLAPSFLHIRDIEKLFLSPLLQLSQIFPRTSDFLNWKQSPFLQ